MPLKSLPPLAFSLQTSGENIAQPLPADEQLALLLRQADEDTHTHSAEDLLPRPVLPLHEAYLTCKHTIRQHSKSFFFSTQFLPIEQRRAVWALYAFCRTTDDTVDMATDDPARALAEWVRMVQSPTPPLHHPVLLAWYDTRRHYHLPDTLINELLAGVAMDLTMHRYATFADLWLYCYRVASVVGILSMGIIGSAPGAEPYAIKLGVALQLTNILRDVGEDARRGRVYLPQEDLERFGLCGDDILAGVQDTRFQALMQAQIARTRQLYAESWAGIVLLPPECRLAVGAAAGVYRGILDKVVANRYDVYSKRAHLTFREKLALLPGIWRNVRRLERTATRSRYQAATAQPDAATPAVDGVQPGEE